MVLMFRIVVYAALGLVIVGLFSPLIPNLSGTVWGIVTIFGAIFGAAIGAFLNRLLGTQVVWHPDQIADRWEGRSILPGPLRSRVYDWLRTVLGAPPRT